MHYRMNSKREDQELYCAAVAKLMASSASSTARTLDTFLWSRSLYIAALFLLSDPS